MAVAFWNWIAWLAEVCVGLLGHFRDIRMIKMMFEDRSDLPFSDALHLCFLQHSLLFLFTCALEHGFPKALFTVYTFIGNWSTKRL